MRQKPAKKPHLLQKSLNLLPKKCPLLRESTNKGELLHKKGTKSWSPRNCPLLRGSPLFWSPLLRGTTVLSNENWHQNAMEVRVRLKLKANTFDSFPNVEIYEWFWGLPFANIWEFLSRLMHWVARIQQWAHFWFPLLAPFSIVTGPSTPHPPSITKINFFGWGGGAIIGQPKRKII